MEKTPEILDSSMCFDNNEFSKFENEKLIPKKVLI